LRNDNASGLFLARRWCVGIKNPELRSSRALRGGRDGLVCREGAENNVAYVVEAVGKLHDEQTAIGEINRRLKRLKRRNQK
jgi:hypothetical protein